MKKTKMLFIAVGALLAVTGLGRAQIIYSDSFESPGDTSGNLPTGWGYTGGTVGSNQDFAVVGTTGAPYTSTVYSGMSGSQATYIENFGDTTPSDFFNGNVGATFAANTTYTLTYKYGIPETYGGYYYYGPEAVSLAYGGTATQEINNASTGYTYGNTGTEGTVIGSSTQNLTLAELGATNGNGAMFFNGPTLTFDTASNASVVGKTIGIDATWTDDLTGRITVIGWDNFVLTATADTSAVPEPSTYALLVAGALIMGVMLRRKDLAV